MGFGFTTARWAAAIVISNMPPKDKKRKTRQTEDVKWCDNWLLNRTIQMNSATGRPCPEVELRLSQVPRMLNFMGSFAAANKSYISIFFETEEIFLGCGEYVTALLKLDCIF